MGAVDSQLMGAAGDGPQSQLADAILALQNFIFRSGGFAFLVYITQKTGQRSAGDGGIDGAGIRFRAAHNHSVLGLLQRRLLRIQHLHSWEVLQQHLQKQRERQKQS